MTEQLVDFVIPHMGRPELLEATIKSILTQTALAYVGQIIIVTKNTSPLALPADPKVSIFYRPEAKTISEQRNFGAAQGKGNYLAFLDADIQLAPDWLATCLTLLQQPGRVVVSAMQQNSAQPSKVEQLRTTLSNAVVDCAVNFLPGRNLLLSRAHHLQVGGFPEHLQTCEDYYYTDKLSHLGELYYTSQSSYVHLGEDQTLNQTFRKEIWRSEYNLKSLHGRAIPLREWPSILLPFWILFGFMALLGCVFYPAWLSAAIALLLLPVILYSLRLYRLPDNSVDLMFLMIFYSVYFTARAIGTLYGVRFFFSRKDAL